MDAAYAKIYPFFNSLKGKKKEVVRQRITSFLHILTPHNQQHTTLQHHEYDHDPNTIGSRLNTSCTQLYRRDERPHHICLLRQNGSR